MSKNYGQRGLVLPTHFHLMGHVEEGPTCAHNVLQATNQPPRTLTALYALSVPNS